MIIRVSGSSIPNSVNVNVGGETSTPNINLVVGESPVNPQINLVVGGEGVPGYSGINVTVPQFVSQANRAISSSYAGTASFAYVTLGTQESASYAQFADLAKVALQGTGSFTGSFIGDGTYLINIQSSSFAEEVPYTGIQNVPAGIVSSSTQATSWTVATASTANSVQFDNIEGVPTLVSSSGQVIYNEISQIPSGIVSSSAQVQFSGIANIPAGILSSSTQVNAILDADGVFSSSAQVQFNGISGRPTGLVSSSVQVNYPDISNIPVGIVSSSTQFNALSNTSASFATTTTWTGVNNKPTGLVSSSDQVSYSGLSNTPVGIVSSSTQASTWTVATASLANGVQYTNVLNRPTLVSSSTQIDYTSIQNKPTTIPTASFIEYANVVNKPALVSSSAQISYVGLSNTPSGILSSSAQVNAILDADGVISSSTQVNYDDITGRPTGLVSSSTQISYTGLSNIPSGIVSSSTQAASWTVATASLAITASYALNGGTGGGSGLFASSSVSSSWASQSLSSSYAETVAPIIRGMYETGSGIPLIPSIVSASYAFTSSVVIGTGHFTNVSEQFQLLSNIGAGTSSFDYSDASIFYVTNLTANGVWNIVNVPEQSNVAYTIAFILRQAATPYSASAFHINSVPVTVLWQENSITGSANARTTIGLTAFRSGSSWDVLGAISSFR